MYFILHNKHSGVHTCTSYDCMHACSPMIACSACIIRLHAARRTRFFEYETHTHTDTHTRTCMSKIGMQVST